MSFVDQWLEQIRKTDAVSTYKMAWAKAITHVAYDMVEEDLLKLRATGEPVTITLFAIAEKFLSYYWDQDVFFRLSQTHNPNKTSSVVAIIRSIEPRVFEILGSPRVHLFAHIHHQIKVADPAFYSKTVNKIVKVLKQDVSHRFLNGSDEAQRLYDYKKNDDALIISAEYVLELRENLALVLDVISLRWIMLLEQYNNTPRIAMKVKHMDLEGFKRSSLKKFHEAIALENPDRLCFECGKPIRDSELAIDHVIPWSYLYSDDLWNLVFIHKSCNSKKSNTIPSKAQIEELKARNRRLLEGMQQRGSSKTKVIFELQDAIEHNLVERFWIQCNG